MRSGARFEEVLQLPADPVSAGQARRFLQQLLRTAGREEWSDAASLAVSELVTNSVLHGHSAVQVTGQVHADHVRIEVRDFNPTLPSPRSYDDQATTGRGLELIAAVTTRHGVESLGENGKVVWCCVGDPAWAEELTAEELLAGWNEDNDAHTSETRPPADPDSVVIQLLGMPAALWLAAREHHDALLRELALVRSSPTAAREVSADLVAADTARFQISSAVDGAIDRARHSGDLSTPLPQDLTPHLPAGPAALDVQLTIRRPQAEAFAKLQDALDEGERLAAADKLLVRPGLPEIVAVRDWACEQAIAQVAGSPPAPWAVRDYECFAAHVDRKEPPPGWDARKVTTAQRGVIAVDEANRVLAVSGPLAAALGWAPDDLVGRRVVAIVPPRYREAHVAGFSRHLSTGTVSVLGLDLRLPVLRADGTEIECAFRVDSEPIPNGRSVYLAWISPLAGAG